jgi:hypothetical protein
MALALAAAIALSVTLFATEAASKERPGRPAGGVPASIQLTPDPLAITCDGVDFSTITVRVTDARGKAVPDGTIVHFDARFGSTDPVEAATNRGEASTEARFFTAALQFPGETAVDVFVGDLRASIGVDCFRPEPCNPFSPPAHPMSPPCEPLPCSDTDSPPIGQSPPCPPVVCDAPFSPPCNLYEMRLDADQFSSGVQDFGAYSVGQPFTLAVHATSVGDEPYAGYRWLVEWPETGLAFGGVTFEQGPFLNLETCSSGPQPPVIDPAYDDAFGGGCSSIQGWSTSFAGELTNLQMTCTAPGYALIHLVSENLAEGFGSTFIALSGAEFQTTTYNALVLCEEPPCGPISSPPCATPPPGCEHPMSPPCGTPTPEPSVTLALDANISNGSGPCTQIDDVTSISPGQQVQVGVCLLDPSAVLPLAAVQYRVTYDDRVVVVPEIANAGTGLDDNPDANAGATTFTSTMFPVALGGGWDCSGGVGAYPQGDQNGIPGDGVGVAYSGGCGSAAGPNTLLQGPLGIITFQAVAVGITSLSILEAGIVNDDLIEVGSCAPTIERPMLCLGASIVVAEGPQPTPTVTATPTPAITPIVTTVAQPVNRPRGSRALD